MKNKKVKLSKQDLYYDPNSPKMKLRFIFIGIKDNIKKYFKKHKVTAVLLILFIALNIAIFAKHQITMFSYSKMTGEFKLQDASEYMESLKDVPSDIEGMSQYDKYAMGLDYHNGSDTDQDGLTDKDEIEKYKTDPLKSSSSGDLYSDGYKISKGMDVNTCYEYQNDMEYVNNGCKEVVLTAQTATDFSASIEECTERYSLENWGIKKVYKAYFIYGFAGSFSTDISQVLSDYSIAQSDISVWTYEGSFVTYGMSDLRESKYHMEGNKLILEHEFNKDRCTYVFITEKRGLLNSLLSSFGEKKTTQLRQANIPHYLIVNTFTKTKIYYPTQDNKTKESEMIKNIAAALKAYDTEFIGSTEAEIKSKYSLYHTVLPFLEFDLTYGKKTEGLVDALTTYLPMLAFCYQYCDYDTATINAAAGGSNSEDVLRYRYNNYHTSFDPNVDELPFQNFSSRYSNGGNCAGICYLTCFLHNQGYFPESGSYEDISWDISKDPENKTLMDKGLSDFKSKDFVDKKGGGRNYLDDNLTAGEREFVDMIGASWKMTNDMLIQSCMESYRIENKTGLSWDIAETIIQRLDAGKIVTMSLALNDNTGHQIVIYDYYYINDTELMFRVYDCNIPMNHTDDSDLNCDGACYLQCKKVKNASGGYNLLYLYYPLEGVTTYVASSDPSISPYSVSLISDETLQVYNH